jgi:hypothetical protein
MLGARGSGNSQLQITNRQITNISPAEYFYRAATIHIDLPRRAELDSRHLWLAATPARHNPLAPEDGSVMLCGTEVDQ